MRISVVSRKIVIAIITHILLIVQRRGMDRVGDRVESWTGGHDNIEPHNKYFLNLIRYKIFTLLYIK